MTRSFSTQAIATAWLVFAAFLSAGQAQAMGCEGLEISVTQDQATVYDPRESADALVFLRLVPEQIPESCRNPDIVLRPVVGNQIDFFSVGERLRGDFARSTPNFRVNGGNAVLSKRVVSLLLDGEPVEIGLLEVQKNQFSSPGIYRADLSLLIDGQTNGVFDVEVETDAVIAFVGKTSTDPEEIDFGVLTPGESQKTNFLYRSNARVEITAFSENGGVLMNTSGLTSTPIPYSAELNGRVLSLDAPVPFEDRTKNGKGVTVGKLRITIGAFQNAMSGVYRDVLTLELRAF